MNYNIIETGSKGNAVIFNGVVMVDCGVAFNKLLPFLQDLQLVLLTHIHSDHFCKRTIKRLAKERPTLRFGCPEWLIAPVVECGVKKQNIDMCFDKQTLWYRDYDFLPFELEHDVPNCGYLINFKDDSIVYATDTATLPDSYHIKNQDFYFIEANYKNEEELAERMQAKVENGDYIYEKRVSENHMSEKYALDWLVRNGRPDSKHVFLHEHKEV